MYWSCQYLSNDQKKIFPTPTLTPITLRSVYRRALDSVIGPELDPFALANLDDIIVIGRDLAEHTRSLREVFRLRAANLTRINVQKN